MFSVEDVERSVYEKLLPVSFVWPSVTHQNVWEMPYDIWCLYVDNVDDFLRLKMAASNPLGVGAAPE